MTSPEGPKPPESTDPLQRSLSLATPEGGTPSDTVFSPGFRGEMGKQLFTRAEIAATILLDGCLLVVALAVRAGLLWLVHHLSPEPPPGGLDEPLRDWAVRMVEGVLNFGLVGTVVLVTAFDLLKRIKQGYRGFRGQ